MNIDRAAVLRIAALAALRLDNAEADRLAGELAGILAHVEELGTLDVAGVPEFSVAVEAGTAARPDTPGADPLATGPDAFAPGWSDPFFTVPRLGALDPDARAEP